MRIGRTGALAMTVTAAIALATLDLRPAAAESLAVGASGIQAARSDEVTTRKRHRYYRPRGNAAAARAFGAIAGTIGGIIAAQQARRYYRRHYWGYYPYYAAPYGPYYAPYGYDPYW
jgi:hypothetical protein